MCCDNQSSFVGWIARCSRPKPEPGPCKRNGICVFLAKELVSVLRTYFFFFYWKPQVVSLTHKALHTGGYIGLVRCNPPTLSLVTALPSHAYSSVFGQMQVNRPSSKYWSNVNYFVGRCYTCMTRKIQHPPATYEYVFLHRYGSTTMHIIILHMQVTHPRQQPRKTAPKFHVRSTPSVIHPSCDLCHWLVLACGWSGLPERLQKD